MEETKQRQEVKTQYAVMVPMSFEPDDYLYVTEVVNNEQKVLLFDSEQKAISHASIWGRKAKVVEYISDAI